MLLQGSWGRWWKLGRKVVVAVRTALFVNPISVTKLKRDYSTVKVAYKTET